MLRTYNTITAIVFVSGLLTLPFSTARAAEEDRKTVWTGVYTDAQATRGQATYSQDCSRCHRPDLSGYNSVLKGERFMQQWREDNLRSLFERVKTMPPNAPASLKDPAYVDIVAYLLRENAFPAGASQLDQKSLEEIKVEGKEGPSSVPSFSLVEVAGCLVKDAAPGSWSVTKATEPVRTRNPFASSAAELETIAKQPAGNQTFHILDATNLPATVQHLNRVKAKGFLIRKTGDDRINITSVEPLGGSCSNP